MKHEVIFKSTTVELKGFWAWIFYINIFIFSATVILDAIIYIIEKFI